MKNFKLEVFVCKFLLSIIVFFLRSYLVMIVWNWRLIRFVPQLELPEINIWQAGSLQVSIAFLVVGLLRLQSKDKDETRSEYYPYFESAFITGFFIILVWAFSYL